jgi:hypothetical protein
MSPSGDVEASGCGRPISTHARPVRSFVSPSQDNTHIRVVLTSVFYFLDNCISCASHATRPRHGTVFEGSSSLGHSRGGAGTVGPLGYKNLSLPQNEVQHPQPKMKLAQVAILALASLVVTASPRESDDFGQREIDPEQTGGDVGVTAISCTCGGQYQVLRYFDVRLYRSSIMAVRGYATSYIDNSILAAYRADPSPRQPRAY